MQTVWLCERSVLGEKKIVGQDETWNIKSNQEQFGSKRWENNEIPSSDPKFNRKAERRTSS